MGFLAGRGPAQVPFRSPVSPYINLGQPGIDPGIAYYGIVRPELEFRKNIQSLQQRQFTQGRDIAAQAEANGLPTTGHPIAFFNQSKYFLNLGAQPAGKRAALAVPAPRRRSR